jgi:hypothetical protein
VGSDQKATRGEYRYWFQHFGRPTFRQIAQGSPKRIGDCDSFGAERSGENRVSISYEEFVQTGSPSDIAFIPTIKENHLQMLLLYSFTGQTSKHKGWNFRLTDMSVEVIKKIWPNFQPTTIPAYPRAVGDV